MKKYVIIIFLYFILHGCLRFEQAKAILFGDKDSISEYKIGFGVPGHGKPLIDGDFLYIPPGEGDITEIEIKDKTKPRVKRFLETKYFFHEKIFKVSNYIYFNESRGGNLCVIDLRKDVTVTYTVIERFIDSDVKILGKDYGLLQGTFNSLGFFIQNNKIVLYDLANPSKIVKVTEIEGYSDLHIEQDKKTAIFYNNDTISKYSLINIDKPAKILDKKIDLKDKEIFFSANYFTLLSNKVISLYHSESLDKIIDIKLTIDEPVVIRDIVSKGKILYLLDARRGGGAHSVNRSSPHSRIHVYDIEKKSFVSKYDDKNISEYAYGTIDGSYLYVNDYNYGIRILDISDPLNIKEVSSVPVACEGRFGGVINDKLVYIGSTFGGHIFFVDVSDKNNMKGVGFYWDGTWGRYWTRMVPHKDFLFVPKNESVEILNIKKPDNVRRISELTYENGKSIGGGTIIKIDKYLYVTTPSESGEINLLTFDLSAPESPVLKSEKSVKLVGRILIGALKDAIVLSAEGENKILIFDIKERENPRLILTYETKEPVGRYFITYKNYIYAIPKDRYDTSLFIYKFDGLKVTFVKKAEFTTGIVRWSRFFTDGIVVKDKLYMNSYDFINVIDLKTPENPSLVDRKFVGYKWTIGDYLDGHLFVPTLRGLKIVKVE